MAPSVPSGSTAGAAGREITVDRPQPRPRSRCCSLTSRDRLRCSPASARATQGCSRSSKAILRDAWAAWGHRARHRGRQLLRPLPRSGGRCDRGRGGATRRCSSGSGRTASSCGSGSACTPASRWSRLTVWVGMDVHRAARIAASAHGGQIVLSDSTRALVAGHLPAGVRLVDLGEVPAQGPC